MNTTTAETMSIMKHCVRLTADQSGISTAEFRIGALSVPYLADHGFQGMVVMPGAFYVELALCMDRRISTQIAYCVRNVTFLNPIILSTEETIIRVEARDHGNEQFEYSFYEGAAADSGTASLPQQQAATLIVDRRAPPLESGLVNASFMVGDLQLRSDSMIDATVFYQKLRANGNEYGPDFQKVLSIWQVEGQWLGKIDAAHLPQRHEPFCLHPILMDCATQVLACLILEKGRTFVLRSIKKIEITDAHFPNTLWAYATVSPASKGNGAGVRGDIRVSDHSGKTYLTLSGVELALLDGSDAKRERTTENVVIASNFTAEPLQDSLSFWGDHFGTTIQAQFTPYNQIFQQLLDTGSAFRRNADGINVIVLGLEEWIARDQRVPMTLGKEKAAQCFGTRSRYVLPNGMEIVHLNQYETDYVYKEIFEDQCYLRHGIQLQDGDTVIDIGANIGLFSLFVMSRCRNATIYACEPAPMVYDLLLANCEAYGSNVRALNVGVSDSARTATFTFYEKSSVFSSFHSDESEDRKAIQTVVRNMLSASIQDEPLDEYVDELTADRLRRQTHECQLTTVSDLIRENHLDKIDLLKIDAEKAELDILKGIGEHDWPKIRQIVLEIHDPTGKAIEHVEHLLREKGYRCARTQEKLLDQVGLINLYACRISASEAAHASPETKGRDRFQLAQHNLMRSVDEFGGALRSLMSAIKVPLVLCVSPRSPKAEIDAELKATLDAAEHALMSDARQVPNVYVIGSETWSQRYPVKDYYDSLSHQLGHIPYTPEGYAAIGTALVRTFHNLRRNPYKVVVLDCDNTLWKGVCGEDGPMGVEISEPYRALQEFMIGQMNAGMVLCLCSKNNEKDALDVFEQRTDMPLKRHHLVSWRINWKSKSENIRALAKELNLGLDSFIFIDDNPVECAEVKINYPEVLTLNLPTNPEAIGPFLHHVWAFDHLTLTQEDQRRTKMYQESAARERYHEQSFSLTDFIKGLALQIDIEEPKTNQLDRVSQLTSRTNQFNFTTIRRSRIEIENLLRRGDTQCLAIHVKDRFGEYGLVGVLIYELRDDRFWVDTFLLSCRVLGRGVEHEIVARLGESAFKAGKTLVEFAFQRTTKNSPALEFISGISTGRATQTAASWIFPAEVLKNLQYEPDHSSASVAYDEQDTTDTRESGITPARAFSSEDQSGRLQRIGEHLHDIERLARAIKESRLAKQHDTSQSDGMPAGGLENTLAQIWSRVLGRPGIGLNDNFFDLGGTSLRAVQVIAAIKKELNCTLSIVNLFESPTVAMLAVKLGTSSGQALGAATSAAATQRGQQRRYNTFRRSAS